MYASVRKYRVESERMDELMKRIESGFAARIGSDPGFLSYQALDCGTDHSGGGVVITISTFTDYDAAERSAEAAKESVARELAEFAIEPIEAATGEVKVDRTSSPTLDPAGA